MSGNVSIGYQGLFEIGQALVAHHDRHGLVELQLAGCTTSEAANDTRTANLKDAACRALAEGLRRSSTIQEFNLKFNSIDSAGVLVLLHAVTNHPSMTKLILHCNKPLELEAIYQITQLLSTLRLNELYLTDHVAPGIASSTSALAVQARRALLEGIINNFSIYKLELPFLGLDKQVDFYTDLNRYRRKHLLLDDEESSGVSPALWSRVLELLNGKKASTTSHMYYFLREQPWLVTTAGHERRSNHSKYLLSRQLFAWYFGCTLLSIGLVHLRVSLSS